MEVHVGDTRVFQDSKLALNHFQADLQELFKKLIEEVRSEDQRFVEAEGEMIKRSSYYKGLELAATAGISAGAAGILSLTVAGIGVVSLITLVELDASLERSISEFRMLRTQLDSATRALQEHLEKYDNYLSLEVPNKVKTLKHFEQSINSYLATH